MLSRNMQDCGNSGLIEGEISAYDAKNLDMDVAKRELGKLPPDRKSEIASSKHTTDDQLSSGEKQPKQLFKR